jgi:sporulation protein YlmC with PRC-barrel domain
MIRSADLQGAKVIRADGKVLGRVTELHLKGGGLNTLVFGPSGLLQRFWPWRRGRRVAWEKVQSVEPGQVRVTAD